MNEENRIFARTLAVFLSVFIVIEASPNSNRPFFENSSLIRYLHRRSLLDGYYDSAATVSSPSPRREKRVPKKCANDSEIISKILGPQSQYNPNKIPGNSVSVEVEVWVQEITTISDITSDFQLDIYISELWRDPDLEYEYMKPCKHNLSLTYKNLEKIWTPNSCFINSKEADVHESPFRFVFSFFFPLLRGV